MTRTKPKAGARPADDRNGDAPSATSADNQLSDVIRDRADALFRSAVECCRQRERAARLMDVSASQSEQRAANTLAEHADEMLLDAIASYEKAAGRARPAGAPEWWHRANILWMASRDYERRHRDCDHSTRRLEDRDSTTLANLALDYDLEASALLALQHVTDDYRKCRPEADLFGQGKR